MLVNKLQFTLAVLLHLKQRSQGRKIFGRDGSTFSSLYSDVSTFKKMHVLEGKNTYVSTILKKVIISTPEL